MLIVGCGAVGTRVASRAKANGAQVTCIVRTAESAKRLCVEDQDAICVDLDQALPSLDITADLRQIFYFAPPPTTGREDPRIDRFLKALPTTAKPRLVYISTTGVYGNCEGEWVDETRPVNPQVDRARRRWDAECRLQVWRREGGGELVILRVAGIYGPSKLPLERLRRGVPMIAEADAPWTNRIHIDDLVSVCEAAMARGRDGEVYNASDGQPGNMRDYFDRVADLFDLVRAPTIDRSKADAELSPGMLSYLAESRRLDNRKMLDELAIELRYPDLASGLRACISSV